MADLLWKNPAGQKAAQNSRGDIRARKVWCCKEMKAIQIICFITSASALCGTNCFFCWTCSFEHEVVSRQINGHGFLFCLYCHCSIFAFCRLLSRKIAVILQGFMLQCSSSLLLIWIIGHRNGRKVRKKPHGSKILSRATSLLLQASLVTCRDICKKNPNTVYQP